MFTLIMIAVLAIFIALVANHQHVKKEEAYFAQIEKFEDEWQAQVLQKSREKYLHA